MSGSYFLYAEDDADDIDIMREMVDRQKITNELICVNDGFDLLDHLQHVGEKQSYPSLIILDLRLPRLDGMETLELLRTDDLYRLIPVVIFSSKISLSDTERCRSLGAEVLIKPLTYMEWLEVFEHFSAYLDE